MNKTQVQGILPEDVRGCLIPIPSKIQTTDNTSTPQVSPVTVTTNLTLAVPNNALYVNLYSTTAFYVSENSASNSKDIIPASTKVKLPCAGLQNLYLTVSSATVYFSFETLS